MNAAYMYAWEPDAYNAYDLNTLVKDNLYDNTRVRSFIKKAASTKFYAKENGGFLNDSDIELLIDGQDTSQEIMSKVSQGVSALHNQDLIKLAEKFSQSFMQNGKFKSINKNSTEIPQLIADLESLLTECEKITGKAMEGEINRVAAIKKTEDNKKVKGYMGNFVTTGQQLTQSQKQVETAMKSIYTSANKIKSWIGSKSQYISASTGEFRDKTIDKDSTFADVASSLLRSIVFFIGFAEEVFYSKSEIDGQAAGLKYIGSLNRELMEQITASNKEKLQGTFLEDLTFEKDQKELEKLQKEYQYICNQKFGNPKADFLMSVDLNGNCKANIGIQWKSSYFSEENSLPGEVNAGAFGMKWSRAFQQAELYGLKMNKQLDVPSLALQLYTAMPYNQKIIKRNKEYYLNGGNEIKDTNKSSSLAEDFASVRDATEKLMVIDGIIGSGKTIDSNLFYVIKGTVVSSLQLAYQALIQNGGYALQKSSNKTTMVYNAEIASNIQQKNWVPVKKGDNDNSQEAQSRSEKIKSSYNSIFNQALTGKIRINLNLLTLTKTKNML